MKKLSRRLLLTAVLALPSLIALSQVVPPVRMSPYGAIFAQSSVVRLESGAGETQYGNRLYGGDIGADFQFRPWLGMDTRVLVLESRGHVGHEHQRAAFAGPRFSLDRGRLKMYAVALGGISHVHYVDFVDSPTIQYPSGQYVLTAATEPALRAGGGIDLQLTRHMFWRMGEVTYSHMFVPIPSGWVGPDGPQGANFSTGLVLKILR
jgi:hypothetical protein